jgi:NhaP-type Na+/H+ or K+/H+ antiporter
MLYLIENKYGTKKGIPQMIMACASVDDVFVIVLFSVFTSLAQGGSVSALSFLQIPISIVLGAAIGVVFGFVLSVFFTKAKTRSTINVIIILCTAFVLVTLESILKGKIPFSALLAVMALGITVRKKVPDTAEKLSSKFSKIWVGAEVMLFALVGAATDVKYAVASGGVVVIVLLGALCFRAIGVVLCTIKTNLNMKERIFCVLAYLPKATVQAAIGSMPLAMGLACGKIVLTGAVLAILITAPLGALGIDLSYKKLLIK